jgi:anaerobic selenocysteine-containing dehydrogenase
LDHGEARGLEQDDRVTVTSHFRGETRQPRGFTAVEYDIPRGCAAAYFPEANVLVPLEQFAEKSRTPASKSVVISVALDLSDGLPINQLPSGIRLRGQDAS